jgi:5-methylcytosine-specific restriction protein A
MRIKPEFMRATLVERFGVGLVAEERSSSDGQRVVVSPSDLPERKSFRLELLLGWRSVNVEIVSGAYSRDLVASMGRADTRQQEVFRGFLKSASEKGAVVTVQVNGCGYSFADHSIWAMSWEKFQLNVERHPVVPKDTSPEEVAAVVVPWVSNALGAVLSLLPLEADDEQARQEGAKREVTATRYERDPFNRALCLEIHGTTCKACGFDFGESYGQIGQGFIDVHHVDQLSEQGGNAVAVNPIVDLVPLCSNCHSMAHRRTPPYSVQELRGFIEAQQVRPNTTPPG